MDLEPNLLPDIGLLLFPSFFFGFEFLAVCLDWVEIVTLHTKTYPVNENFQLISNTICVLFNSFKC